jgi:hypothetical protein
MKTRSDYGAASSAARSVGSELCGDSQMPKNRRANKRVVDMPVGLAVEEEAHALPRFVQTRQAVARRHVGQQRRELRLPAFDLRGGQHFAGAAFLRCERCGDCVGREPTGVAQFQCASALLRPGGVG